MLPFVIPPCQFFAKHVLETILKVLRCIDPPLFAAANCKHPQVLILNASECLKICPYGNLQVVIHGFAGSADLEGVMTVSPSQKTH